MALSRRTGARFQAAIWPGFVDAMTGLLLVLMFVLTIFIVIQFVLRETIKGQGTELEKLGDEITLLGDALGLEQQTTSQLRAEVSQLSAQLLQAEQDANAQANLIDTLSRQRDEGLAQLEQANESITDFEAKVALLLTERESALAEITVLGDKLAATQEKLDAEQEAARLAAAQRALIDQELAASQEKAKTLELDLTQALAALASQQTQTKELTERSENLQASLAQTQMALTAEEEAKLAEQILVHELRKRLEESQAELTALTLRLEQERQKAEETLTLLAAARIKEQELSQAQADELAQRKLAEQKTASVLSEKERQDILLAEARNLLNAEKELSQKSQLEVEALNQQVAALRGQLGELTALLDASEARSQELGVSVTNLGSRLNAALAEAALHSRRVQELETAERERLEEEKRQLEEEAKTLAQFKSEFLGKFRALLEGRDGVRLVGDRFVFSSEILFSTGEAELSTEGKKQLSQIASLIKEIATDIPDGIDWVLQVDGHTDNVPIRFNTQYVDNWELSQARALSVVRYLSQFEGIAENRLSANGFGQHQPLNDANTDEARAQNRRIELKFTEK